MIGDYCSDESDNSEGGCSDEGDDDTLADSTDSLGRHVKSKEEPIPGDAFDFFQVLDASDMGVLQTSFIE